MIALVFSYEARDAAEFERVYGPDGEWAAFFRGGRGYVGTELLRDVETPGRYLVIDRWDSREAYNDFVERAPRRVHAPRRRDRVPLRAGAAARHVRERLGVTGAEAGDRVPPHHDPACWGCGDNPNGIRLPRPEVEGLTEYDAWFQFDERHQAAPGLVHGGLVAAALDEAAGLLATWYAFPTVTGADLRALPPPGPDQHRAARPRASSTGERGRRLHVTPSSPTASERLAEARAAFLHVPLEHFLGTPEGRAAGEAWRRRLHPDG